jgi:glucose/arabinose dehydrogenase
MEGSSPAPKRTARTIVWVIAVIVFAFFILLFIALVVQKSVQPNQIVSDKTAKATGAPELTVTTVASNLNRPWDIAFLPDDTLLFSERGGTLSRIDGDAVKKVADIPDVKAGGEGGLLGLAVDPQFTDNRFIYACYNSSNDVRVTRWMLGVAMASLDDKKDIVTGIPANPSGRHSGCRMAFGPDGALWIGTGDSAQAGLSPQTPQDPLSLGGKILRVDRDGNPASDNLDAPFDARIYSYGHRNTQGIAFLPRPLDGIIGFSAEHGSSVDDEVNILKKGNFGWDPDVDYSERKIPMTDKEKFPDAIEASWRSGSPTQAPSGLTVITGEEWQGWNGSLAMAMLKDRHVKLLFLTAQGDITKEEKIVTNEGRIRDVKLSPDGKLYISTDNGNNQDKILSITPKPAN